MTVGIIMAVLGIFGIVVFSYLAYNTYITPIEDEKAKLLGRTQNKEISLRNITGKIGKSRNTGSLNTTSSLTTELLDIPDDTELLVADDDTELLNI